MKSIEQINALAEQYLINYDINKEDYHIYDAKCVKCKRLFTDEEIEYKDFDIVDLEYCFEDESFTPIFQHLSCESRV